MAVGHVRARDAFLADAAIVLRPIHASFPPNCRGPAGDSHQTETKPKY